jgi:HlyD family secretion protein
LRSINNLIEIYKYILSDKLGTYNPIADTHFSTLNGYTSKTNSHLLTLLSAKNSIDVNKDAIISSDRAIEVRELSLEKIKEGATDLEVRIKQLAVEQKQADLDDAQETLANYSIRSPFSGNISVVNVSEEDMVNVNAIMGSIITHEKIATIILNEVDIANVKVGQEANITFDALDDFTVKGEVYEVDTIGTANQGVVSYGVKIYFNTDNESVKPGMSISASLIIQSVSDVLVIPISAVKVMDEKSFVSVMNDDGTIERKIIEIGITDDYLIEVKNGLEIGDKIVTSTVVKNVAEKDTNEKKINAMQFVPGNTENIKQVIPGGGRGR